MFIFAKNYTYGCQLRYCCCYSCNCWYHCITYQTGLPVYKIIMISTDMLSPKSTACVHLCPRALIMSWHITLIAPTQGQLLNGWRAYEQLGLKSGLLCLPLLIGFNKLGSSSWWQTRSFGKKVIAFVQPLSFHRWHIATSVHADSSFQCRSATADEYEVPFNPFSISYQRRRWGNGDTQHV